MFALQYCTNEVRICVYSEVVYATGTMVTRIRPTLLSLTPHPPHPRHPVQHNTPECFALVSKQLAEATLAAMKAADGSANAVFVGDGTPSDAFWGDGKAPEIEGCPNSDDIKAWKKFLDTHKDMFTNKDKKQMALAMAAASQDKSWELTIGDTFVSPKTNDAFKIIKQLGESGGAEGDVFLVTCTTKVRGKTVKDAKYVAKVQSLSRKDEPLYAEYMELETHQGKTGVPTVFEYFKAARWWGNPQRVMIMQLAGKELQTYDADMTDVQVRGCLSSTINVLAELEKDGKMFGELKEDMIMINDDKESVKVIDWGSVQTLKPEVENESLLTIILSFFKMQDKAEGFTYRGGGLHPIPKILREATNPSMTNALTDLTALDADAGPAGVKTLFTVRLFSYQMVFISILVLRVHARMHGFCRATDVLLD